jgi:hypothetical protein
LPKESTAAIHKARNITDAYEKKMKRIAEAIQAEKNKLALMGIGTFLLLVFQRHTGKLLRIAILHM